MCGWVSQSSGPLRLAVVDGLDVSDSRLGNLPRRYNAAPSQELLVIRQNLTRRASDPSTYSETVPPNVRYWG
jgi:putative SOS response-associated peptidase YedK